MNGKYCLDIQQQKMASDLAMSIYKCGIRSENCEIFWQNEPVANAIIEYWNNCNGEAVRYALNKLLAFKCVKHLQNCWQLESTTHSKLEN